MGPLEVHQCVEDSKGQVGKGQCGSFEKDTTNNVESMNNVEAHYASRLPTTEPARQCRPPHEALHGHPPRSPRSQETPPAGFGQRPFLGL